MLSDERHAVIELKTGRTTSTISKHDVDQLGGSALWDKDVYPDVTHLPVIVHPSRELDGKATPVPGMRVITQDKWDLLAAAMQNWAEALAAGHARWKDPQAVAEQLAHHKLAGASLFNTYSLPPRRPRA
ncbi:MULTISPECIES: hypothetical protein [Streptosporangium]|uniref:DUF4365 domain-containing protein n=1 Tax=Streptosporangium brasiliense TaxID=47480 RepID=A0ABT9RHR7_9ACTN|nr:hypothetical protein [Streptosporangium brasiliense]MDP9868817.1 hypothetical protein [Streptosporangium brasiliense]